MANSKQTKRALLTSALAILASVAMLIGSTFAWFTDTASTAVNRIEAGTLKLSLEYATAWDGDGNVTTWENAKGKTLSFIQKTANGYVANADILWEPGATYRLQQLRISNVGDLALKYKVVIGGIGGSAKLNKVIDWTIELDGGAYTLGQAHHLAAKSGDAVDTDALTVVGKMQETAGNEYQGEKIEGISVTVYAVQDTVESDSFGDQYDAKADGTPDINGWSWTDDVAVTGTVTAGEDTTLKDREVDPTVTAAIPAGSTTAEKLTLIKTKADAPADLTVATGNETVTADIKLVDQDGNKVTAQGGKFFTLTMQLEPNMVVKKFYHHSTALKAATSVAKLTENDQYYYDTKTGVVTFTTDDFSPFTAEYAFSGGRGTKAYPYLIATGEQALAMEGSKGYFKFVDDVVVTNEIYLSGKTVVVDLNGHTVRLEYADDVKPNNGSVFYIGGRKGNLTINDSSAAQTGAVIGSDKTYSNKVTSAVRAGNYGKLTINGGHFYGMSEGTSCIFVMTSLSSGSKATVTINGGWFETATPSSGTYFVLNHQDSATAGCTITVNGGSFKEYNPGVTVVDPVNAKTGKILLGTGCTTTSAEVDGATWYTVSK